MAQLRMSDSITAQNTKGQKKSNVCPKYTPCGLVSVLPARTAAVAQLGGAHHKEAFLLVVFLMFYAKR